MASSREENPYEGGTGGKFRKRPLKRSQATPYDRPPTALRNASRNNWLSKLVDPAQRLITSSAQMFFSTVFRKRLPPPPPPLPLLEEDEKDLRIMDLKATSADPVAVAGTIHISDNASERNDEYGVSELEQILKQKTFTRSEIDRLTSLLHSRTIDKPSDNEEKRVQQPSSAAFKSQLKEDFLPYSSPEDRLRSHAVSTHLMTSSSPDDDVASPAEIAKAYMESRSSKVSPLILGSQAPAYIAESALTSRHPFHSKTSVTPLVPSLPGNAIVSGNGFMTPRSRGRSAIYTMARTPYSRVHGVTAINNMTHAQDYSGPSSSSSQSAWDQDNTMGSKHGVLKRRSSVLDKDIGSVGPIRRIRQKPNLISSKGLVSPAYGRPISTTEIGVGSEAAHPSFYTVGKSLLSGGNVDKLLERPKENGDSALPSSSIPAIPSKSREMASKILEQIDKLTPPKEKSSELKLFGSRDKPPTKLSPSMLRGQALKSLEEVDSSKYLENLQDNKWLNNSLENSAPDSHIFSSKIQDNAEQNGSVKSLFWSDKPTNIEGSNAVNKDITPNLMSVSSAVNSVLHQKRAFQMSAHEDHLDFDDEGYSNGPAAQPLAGSDKNAGGTLTEKLFVAKEAITAEKPQLSSDVASTVILTDKKSDLKSSEDSAVAESISSFIFPASRAVSVQVANPTLPVDQNITEKELSASCPIFSFGANLPSHKEETTVPAPAPVFSFGDKVTSFKEQSAPPVSTFEDSIVATKRPNTVSPFFNFGDKVDNSIDLKLANNNGEHFSLPKFNFTSTSLLGESDRVKAVASSASKAERSDNSLVADSANSFNAKEPVSDKADNKIISSFGSVPWTSGNVMTNPSSASANVSSSFTFSSSGGNSNLVNGSLTSTTSYFPSSIPPAVVDSNKVTQSFSDTPLVTPATNNSVSGNTGSTTTTATFTSTTPNISFSTSASSSSFPAAPIFKFGAPAPFPSPTSAPVPSPSPSPSPTPAVSAVITGTESVVPESKQETSLGNIGHASLSGSSSSILPNGSSIFGFHAGTTSTGNKDLQALGAGSGSMFGAPLSVSGTGVAASTLSTPIQFGSSSAAPSFGLAGNQASSGSSLFGSTASTTKLFNSSSTFGLVSSSEANTVSGSGSGSGTNSLVFGASWQPSKSPVFGSTFTSVSPQSGFSFGSNSSGASMVFGSSTGAATSSTFSFSSPAALTSSQAVFGNSSPPAFAFGTTSPGMSDQMNEDSMAEDTVHMSTPTVPSFGQQPISPSPSGFVFGSTPSAANPFQFGGQQNLGAPQSSPFQASGSVDFNASAGGSFSLGTAGSDKANRKFVKVKHKQRKK